MLGMDDAASQFVRKVALESINSYLASPATEVVVVILTGFALYPTSAEALRVGMLLSMHQQLDPRLDSSEDTSSAKCAAVNGGTRGRR
jgi:hypothetical protein